MDCRGHYRAFITGGLAPADLIIHLKYPSIFSQWLYLIKRHFKRDNKSLLGLLQLMRHVLYKKYKLGYRRNNITMDEFVAPYEQKLISMKSFREINEFLNSL
jgi:hypothetical protein